MGLGPSRPTFEDLRFESLRTLSLADDELVDGTHEESQNGPAFSRPCGLTKPVCAMRQIDGQGETITEPPTTGANSFTQEPLE